MLNFSSSICTLGLLLKRTPNQPRSPRAGRDKRCLKKLRVLFKGLAGVFKAIWEKGASITVGSLRGNTLQRLAYLGELQNPRGLS